jgi:ParB family chromosome partitioning protein
VCKFTTEAIIAEGSEVGTIHKVCPNPACPVHHPQQNKKDDAKWKADRERQRRQEAIANVSGLRVLSAIAGAVPVRLMKRDLFFIVSKLVSTLDPARVEMLARQHGIRQKRDDGGIQKTLNAFLRRADEGNLSRLLVETTILIASARSNVHDVLKEAAVIYKVDTDAILAKVRKEFAAKEKAKAEPKPGVKVKNAA